MLIQQLLPLENKSVADMEFARCKHYDQTFVHVDE